MEVTVMARWLYYGGDCKARFDCTWKFSEIMYVNETAYYIIIHFRWCLVK